MTNPTYDQFFGRVLDGLGIEKSLPARRALAVVSIAEGVNTYWNPLNSVITVPGSRVLPGNSAQVQMYANPDMGVTGTLALLNGPRWQWVLEAMKVATSRDLILHEFDTVYRSWGSTIDWWHWSWQQGQERMDKLMSGSTA